MPRLRLPGALGRAARGELRARAQRAVDGELARLRTAGPGAVRALAGAPREAQQDGIATTTRVQAEDDGRLLVLVEAWRGRRTLATGGFAMAPDGSTHTPH